MAIGYQEACPAFEINIGLKKKDRSCGEVSCGSYDVAKPWLWPAGYAAGWRASRSCRLTTRLHAAQAGARKICARPLRGIFGRCAVTTAESCNRSAASGYRDESSFDGCDYPVVSGTEGISYRCLVGAACAFSRRSMARRLYDATEQTVFKLGLTDGIVLCDDTFVPRRAYFP